MGTRSRVDFNGRCTDRGPIKIDEQRLISALQKMEKMPDGRYRGNRTERLTARSHLRAAVKFIRNRRIPVDLMTPVEELVYQNYKHLAHRRAV